jgi:hypothetical protein
MTPQRAVGSPGWLAQSITAKFLETSLAPASALAVIAVLLIPPALPMLRAVGQRSAVRTSE